MRDSRKQNDLFAGISGKKFWLLTSLAIFICYLPMVILSHSVLTPDSWSSIKQALGDEGLWNLQPVIFTAFVSVFIHIGVWLGDLSIGVLLFSFVQAAILAMIFAAVIAWMRREKISKFGIAVTYIFYALLPINAMAGIIMWKDVLFAGFGLLLLMLIRQLYIQGNKFFTKKNVFRLLLVAFLFCAWRNNGVYTYILFSIFAVILNYKLLFNWRHLLLLSSPIVLFVVYSIFISSIAGSSPLSEALSVPIQQVARTVKYHSGTISAEDKSTINEVLPLDQLSEKYNPSLSDPVKYSFNNAAFKKDEGKYIGLWLRLFMDYEKTYLAALVYNTYGYIYPYFASSSTTDTLQNNAASFNAINASNTDDIQGKLSSSAYRDLVEGVAPILRNIGFYSCVLLLGLYIAIIRKKRELTGVFIILSCLFLTTMLGPVNGEFRYLYLFVIATPFIMGAVYSNNNPEGKKRTYAK